MISKEQRLSPYADATSFGDAVLRYIQCHANAGELVGNLSEKISDDLEHRVSERSKIICGMKMGTDYHFIKSQLWMHIAILCFGKALRDNYINFTCAANDDDAKEVGNRLGEMVHKQLFEDVDNFLDGFKDWPAFKEKVEEVNQLHEEGKL